MKKNLFTKALTLLLTVLISFNSAFVPNPIKAEDVKEEEKTQENSNQNLNEDFDEENNEEDEDPEVVEEEEIDQKLIDLQNRINNLPDEVNEENFESLTNDLLLIESIELTEEEKLKIDFTKYSALEEKYVSYVNSLNNNDDDNNDSDFEEQENFGYANIDVNFDDSDLVHKKQNSFFQSNYASEIPASYDLRNVDGKNYVTSVKNQNPYGTCWAHAAIASAESYALKKGIVTDADLTDDIDDIDLSELQFAYFTYHNKDIADNSKLITADGTYSTGATHLNEGGNKYWSTYSAASTVGFINEAKLPYTSASSLSYDSKYCYSEDDYYVTDVDWYSIYDDEDIIKKALMENGALAISYYENSAYLNSSTNAYYYNLVTTPLTSANHTVTLIGWDDNYAISNFKAGAQPDGPGAWLVKNSWGTGSRDGGYFWISYYDVSLLDLEGYRVAKYDPNMNVYQYDGSANPNKSVASLGSASMANIYQAKRRETLNAVGVFVDAANYSYEIEIYKVDNLNNPVSGNKVYTQSGKIGNGGYHSINLNEDVIIEKDLWFSVVVKLIRKNQFARIQLDTNGFDQVTSPSSTHTFYYVNNLSNNYSFYKTEGGWVNAVSQDNATARIKVYATEDTTPKVNYKVEHYKQDAADDNNYILEETETKQDYAGTKVKPEVKKYTGFYEPEKKEATVDADGSTVIKYYYNREYFYVNVSIDLDSIVSCSGTYFYRYGKTVTIGTPVLKEGYHNPTYSGDFDTQTFVMPAKNVTINVKASPINYSITYNLDNGTNDSNNPATYNIETNTITLKDPTRTNYTFNGWYDAQTGGKKITEITKGSIGNKTLFARWTVNVKDLTITNKNNQVIYAKNSTINKTDFKVIAEYYDGTTKDVSSTAQITLPKMDDNGNKKVNVTYDSVSKDFDIYVFGTNSVSLSLEGRLIINFYCEYPNYDTLTYTPGVLFFVQNNKPTNAEILSAYQNNKGVTTFEKSDGYLQFTYDKLAAKQMADSIYVVVYGVQSDNKFVYGQPQQFLVSNYKNNMFTKYSSDTNLLKLLADMLIYGSKAQTYFGYNTINLATKTLSSPQVAYATNSAPTVSKRTEAYSDDLSSDNVEITSASISLENEIMINYYASVETDKQISTVELLMFDSYVNGGTYDSSTATKTYNMFIPSGNTLYCGNITNIIAREMRKMFYGRVHVIYDDATEEYSDIRSYSVEDYAYQKINSASSSASLKELVKTMIIYGDSAANYLNNK